jgi:hypothetical protein
MLIEFEIIFLFKKNEKCACVYYSDMVVKAVAINLSHMILTGQVYKRHVFPQT